jgi:hypothetical protein
MEAEFRGFYLDEPIGPGLFVRMNIITQSIAAACRNVLNSLCEISVPRFPESFVFDGENQFFAP